MKTNKIIMAALGIALAGIGANVNAATANSATNFQPSLTITAACAVNVTNVAFPTAPASASSTVVSTGVGTVNVTGCTGVNYKLGADTGAHFASATRHLSSGTAANDIAYNVDLAGPASQTNWGNNGITGAAPTTGTALSRTGASGADAYTITGNLTIPASHPAGTYADSVAVVVEF
jgi:spore coat protein U-like protein